jgi:hypothetical protein
MADGGRLGVTMAAVIFSQSPSQESKKNPPSMCGKNVAKK